MFQIVQMQRKNISFLKRVMLFVIEKGLLFTVIYSEEAQSCSLE